MLAISIQYKNTNFYCLKIISDKDGYEILYLDVNGMIDYMFRRGFDPNEYMIRL